MTTARRPFTRRLSAAALTLALSSAGVAGATLVTAPAFAAVNAAVVDGSHATSLTIHKRLGTTGAQGTGLPDGTVGGAHLNGVQFDVYQVGTKTAAGAATVTPIDLTTAAGWAQAQAIKSHVLTAAEITAKEFTVGGQVYGLMAPSSAKTGSGTNAAGDVVFSSGAVGVYLVNENLAQSPTITNADAGNVQVPTASITPTAPFFVTLPITDPTDTSSWKYDVNVYPKNSSDTITKTVQDAGTTTTDNNGTGKNSVYTLQSSIPAGTASIDTYAVTDNLPANVSFNSAVVTLTGGTLSGAQLVPGTDYVVYVGADGAALSSTFTAPVAGGPTVHVAFTTTGIAKLEANRALKVQTVLNTTVGAESAANAAVSNSASFVPSNAWWTANNGTTPYDPTKPDGSNPGVPTTTPTNSYYGDLGFTKVDSADSSALSGAVFSVYADANGDNACTAADTDTSTTGYALLKSGATSAADGTVAIKGLQASNYYNGATQSTLQGYCLVETKAPTNYNLLSAPIYFTMMRDAAAPNAITAKLASGSTLSSVANQKTSLTNNLPLTGGTGTAVISIGGLLLVGGGLGYYVLSSRRREEADNA